MISARPLLVVACAVLLVGCSSPQPEAPRSSVPHWTYNGKDGPTHWDKVSPSFAECGDAQEQSPVDLPASVPPPDGSTVITINQPSAAGEATDTGHSEEFVPKQPVTTLRYGGREYRMVQMHFHTPSEHTVGGQRAAAEFHLVHQDPQGARLVLAILAREGAPMPGIDQYLRAVADHADEPVVLDFGQFLPSSSPYYAYEGSLTTPPCSESVAWLVLGTQITVSKEQVELMDKLHGDNARPVQPLGKRLVSAGSATFVRK